VYEFTNKNGPIDSCLDYHTEKLGEIMVTFGEFATSKGPTFLFLSRKLERVYSKVFVIHHYSSLMVTMGVMRDIIPAFILKLGLIDQRKEYTQMSSFYIIILCQWRQWESCDIYKFKHILLSFKCTIRLETSYINLVYPLYTIMLYT
jgi:hypothetical protein